MRGPRAGADSRSWDAEFTPSDERTDGMPIARKGADAADLAYLQAIRRIPRLGAVEEADLKIGRAHV